MEAIVVVGPESSGTKMITEVFVRGGYFGDYSYGQRLDNEKFSLANSSKLVFRQSYPHNRRWPSIEKIFDGLCLAGYDKVRLVVTLRDENYNALSQLANKHQVTYAAATQSIRTATQLIFKQADECKILPTIVRYEPFVQNKQVRESFYKLFKLQPPDMVFVDGNKKYAGVVSS